MRAPILFLQMHTKRAAKVATAQIIRLAGPQSYRFEYTNCVRLRAKLFAILAIGIFALSVQH
jgi:hypothetical protein